MKKDGQEQEYLAFTVRSKDAEEKELKIEWLIDSINSKTAMCWINRVEDKEVTEEKEEALLNKLLPNTPLSWKAFEQAWPGYNIDKMLTKLTKKGILKQEGSKYVYTKTKKI